MVTVAADKSKGETATEEESTATRTSSLLAHKRPLMRTLDKKK